MNEEQRILAHHDTLCPHGEHSSRACHKAMQVSGDIAMVDKLLPDVKPIVKVAAKRRYFDIHMLIFMACQLAAYALFVSAQPPVADVVVNNNLIVHR